VAGKEVAAERPGIGRPGKVDAQDEGGSLLKAQATTSPVLWL
jgi:hypothetical protein